MLAPSLQRRGLFCLLMTVSKPRKGGVAKSQKDKHLLSFIHPLLLLIPEIFYLHSSFFFKFIWYLCIYLLTLCCKSNKNKLNCNKNVLYFKKYTMYLYCLNTIWI
jgi:hypothetical protein